VRCHPRIAAAALALLTPCLAQPGDAPGSASGKILRLDPATTKVEFSLGATLHTVRGTAKLSRGEVRFDEATGALGGMIVIDARSLETGEAGRDRKMHAEVLESAAYPEIDFSPERLDGAFEAEGECDVRIAGTMTIHGASHEIVLLTHLRASGGRISGTARFEVPYVAWGMNDPSVFVLRVRKEVQISLEFSGILAAGAAGGPAESP
jgi:polyisoprenoid-binding protein YceI